MPKLSGKCLCGNIKFSGDSEISRTVNCHCSNCRAITGAAFATNVVVDKDAITITGTPKIHKHKADSGAEIETYFCPDCGSQLFGRNSARTNSLSIRAGVLDQTSLIKPSINIFLDSKIESTPIDPELKGFPRMPG
jgi:hypothetical protein